MMEDKVNFDNDVFCEKIKSPEGRFQLIITFPADWDESNVLEVCNVLELAAFNKISCMIGETTQYLGVTGGRV